MNAVRSLAFFGLSACAVCTAFAVPVIDQVGPVDDTRFNVNDPSLVWEQEITAGIAGVLAQVDFFYSDAASVQDIRFFVNRGSGWQSDPDDFSIIVSPIVGTNSVDLSSAGLSFAAGEQFVIGFQGVGPDTGCCNLAGTFPGLYPGGSLFLNGALFEIDPDADFSFITYVDIATPLSEPATSCLLALAALAAGNLRSKFGGGSGSGIRRARP